MPLLQAAPSDHTWTDVNTHTWGSACRRPETFQTNQSLYCRLQMRLWRHRGIALHLEAAANLEEEVFLPGIAVASPRINHACGMRVRETLTDRRAYPDCYQLAKWQRPPK